MRRTVVIAALAGCFARHPAVGQSRADERNSIVIVTGLQATLPIPTLMEGAAANVANMEIADQLFLRLAGLGPTLLTAGDRNFVPLLARAWSRRDSVTLVFDLDPRARWQDGVPVTARDVVFTMERARNRSVSPRLADLLKHITGVTAEGEERVVFRFSHPYAEQLYDATFHVAPIPAHLLDTIPPDALSRSAFAAQPVGNGPYRWVRAVPGQFIELRRNDDFFLGKPKIERVIVRAAADPDARVNLMLSGQADAMDNIPPPQDNIRRIAAEPSLRVIPVPSPTVGYLLFNQRDRRDRERPHPILGDIRVRRALGLALDRRLLVQVIFGSYGEVPFGPASPILWIRHGAPRPERQDLPEARRLLAAAGWRDTDSDGTLDRDGHPLTLSLSLPNTSAIRKQMAVLIQEQLRGIGIRLELQQYDFPIWTERRTAGDFDVDFAALSQDPSPTGLTQSWTCNGGNNVARYCDPRVDSLIEQAVLGRGDPAEHWHGVLRQIEADAPAVFLYAPTYVYAVNRRFRNVSLSPVSSWLLLREWSVAPASPTPSR
ncbi:MAG: peptide/nickel transport system substrate-binding protein [Gemmatimonadales bacterium]|nr:peptide/nickel transport system substrate-binding protein [Gemmatimonadales bacterium]